jgi:pilus assembly protein CpaF
VFSIRKFRTKVFTAEELVRREMLTGPVLECLKQAIVGRQTVLISGGTGSGKTTLLNALAGFMPQDERIVLIEDTSEIAIDAPNLVRLEARRAQPDLPAVTIRDLLRQTLRLRPDRIILGEVRGAEAFDLLQALNTGHTGTLSTIHANTARLAISRLRTCVAMAGIEVPDKAIARNIAEVVQVLVHIERINGARRLSEVLKISRYDSLNDEYELAQLCKEKNACQTLTRPASICGQTMNARIG